MIFDDTSLFVTTQPEKVIPAFQVGTFYDAKRQLRALVPVDKGIVFYVNSDKVARKIVYNQIQYLLLTVLQTVEWNAIQITILDFTIESNFDWLLNLSKVLPVKKVSPIQDFDKEIDRLYQYVLSKNDFLRENQVENLTRYNLKAEYVEAYQIVVLTDTWRKSQNFKAEELRELMELGHRVGIYFICVLDQAAIAAEKASKNTMNQYNRRMVWDTCEVIQAHLIGIQANADGKAEISNLEYSVFHKLTKNFLFKYNQYPVSQVQDLTKHWKEKIMTHTPQNFLSIPIGRNGNVPVLFEMGSANDCFFGFIAGASGTGKSNLLQNLILTLAEKFSPETFHLSIMDYKEGIDFHSFKELPHIELLLLDNSQLDVAQKLLQVFLEEKKERSQRFKELSDTLKGIPIRNIEEYNHYATQKMPRKLLIIDEVHELFFGSYAESKVVQQIFAKLVKQVRAFGMSMIICTQTLKGFDLGEGVMELIRLRLAFSLASEAECRQVLSVENTLPLELEQYHAVLNIKNGRPDNKISGKKYNTIFKATAVGNILDRIAAIKAKWKDATLPSKQIVEKSLVIKEELVQKGASEKEVLFLPKVTPKKDAFDINEKWF